MTVPAMVRKPPIARTTSMMTRTSSWFSSTQEPTFMSTCSPVDMRSLIVGSKLFPMDSFDVLDALREPLKPLRLGLVDCVRHLRGDPCAGAEGVVHGEDVPLQVLGLVVEEVNEVDRLVRAEGGGELLLLHRVDGVAVLAPELVEDLGEALELVVCIQEREAQLLAALRCGLDEGGVFRRPPRCRSLSPATFRGW